VVVEDDGKGFDAAEIAARWGKNQGFGLFSIRERLRHVAGALTIISRPGAGAQIVLTAPLKSFQDCCLQVNSGR
jgi:signal transduction histidine kinase